MPAPRSVLALTLAVALSAGAAGCGKEESDETQVRDTLQRFAAATSAKDFQTLCDDLFAKELVEKIRQAVACELALKNSSLGEAKRPRLEILGVRVKGQKANADVRSSAANQPPSQDTVELIREDGEWRIISLSSG
jgi:hypothetical protein